MATGTNAIALESEVKSKCGSSLSATTNKCCTKARAKAFGAIASALSGYSDNLLVKYSDIYAMQSSNYYPTSGEYQIQIIGSDDYYYYTYNSFYVMVTVTIQVGLSTFVKETRLDLDSCYVTCNGKASTNGALNPFAVSNANYNYIGVVNTDYQSGSAKVQVFPSFTYKYDPTTTTYFNVSITANLYGEGSNDSTQVSSGDEYGSGGGVLLKCLTNSNSVAYRLTNNMSTKTNMTSNTDVVFLNGMEQNPGTIFIAIFENSTVYNAFKGDVLPLNWL